MDDTKWNIKNKEQTMLNTRHKSQAEKVPFLLYFYTRSQFYVEKQKGNFWGLSGSYVE